MVEHLSRVRDNSSRDKLKVRSFEWLDHFGEERLDHENITKEVSTWRLGSFFELIWQGARAFKGTGNWCLWEMLLVTKKDTVLEIETARILKKEILLEVIDDRI